MVLRYIGGRQWLCRCDCGVTRSVWSQNLRGGHTSSCGCVLAAYNTETKTTHGLSRTSEYKTWQTVKQRCRNSNAPNYDRYGGAGITISDDWFNSFHVFIKQMGRKPSPLHSIDRIDGARGYETGNCRWATHREQNNNRKTSRLIEFRGVTKTLAQWARETGIVAATIALRLNRGWPPEKALTKLAWTAKHSQTPAK
jgi:hypothetical protein